MNINVIEGRKRNVYCQPSRRASDGEYRDIAHPISSAIRDCIQTTILEKYRNSGRAGRIEISRGQSDRGFFAFRH